MDSTAGGTSQIINVSNTSAQSNVFNGYTTAALYTTVGVFYRHGSNPTALSNGTDQYIPAGSFIRIGNIPQGYKLAFITTGETGSVYLTQGG